MSDHGHFATIHLSDLNKSRILVEFFLQTKVAILHILDRNGNLHCHNRIDCVLRNLVQLARVLRTYANEPRLCWYCCRNHPQYRNLVQVKVFYLRNSTMSTFSIYLKKGWMTPPKLCQI